MLKFLQLKPLYGWSLQTYWLVFRLFWILRHRTKNRSYFHGRAPLHWFATSPSSPSPSCGQATWPERPLFILPPSPLSPTSPFLSGSSRRCRFDTSIQSSWLRRYFSLLLFDWDCWLILFSVSLLNPWLFTDRRLSSEPRLFSCVTLFVYYFSCMSTYITVLLLIIEIL